jgi:hypothetical protein
MASSHYLRRNYFIPLLPLISLYLFHFISFPLERRILLILAWY